MTRTSQNEFRHGRLWFGFDYDRQAWVVDGRYQTCAHPTTMQCQCYGKLHAGEATTGTGGGAAENPVGELAGPMSTAEAISHAIMRLRRGGMVDREAARVLLAIFEQRGCEDFDPAVRDGRLTTLMDIVIYG
jgi:hypothetical protein